MAKKTKKAGGRTAKRKTSTTITIRHAGATMAQKKGGHKKASHGRKSNPKKKHHRRRNPEAKFGDRLVKLLGGAGVALVTGVGVTVAAGKIMPGQAVSLYGIPALTFLGGVALSKSMPTLGVGMALGSVAPFAIPLASRVLSAGTPSASTTASGIARAMRAVEMGQIGMGAVEMGAMSPHESYEYAG